MDRLVYMIKGLQTPYKQVVAWYFTGAGMSGDKLWTLTKDIIHQLHDRSLVVHGVTSDMDSSNVGMWKAAAISNGSRFCICHPCDVYFVAAVPHLLKMFAVAYKSVALFCHWTL